MDMSMDILTILSGKHTRRIPIQTTPQALEVLKVAANKTTGGNVSRFMIVSALKEANAIANETPTLSKSKDKKAA